MSSGAESRGEARGARLAAEADAEAAARRRQRLSLLGGALLFAAIVVGALVLISQADDSASDRSASDVQALFEGIPQDGIALGEPDAPVTLVEFADPQCPFCAGFTEDVLPSVVEDYVRAGELRMELQLLTFIGPDSATIAGGAYAAGGQDEVWQFADLAFARQEAENSGYGDQAFVEAIAADLDLDADEVVSASASPEVQDLLDGARKLAEAQQVSSTPSFLIGPTGGELTPLDVDSTDEASFAAAIDDALSAAG